MIRYSQQITQWFTGSPIIRGNARLKELQYLLKVTGLKGNGSAWCWAPWSKFWQAQHQHFRAAGVGEDRRHSLLPSDSTEQAGWGSSAPRREQEKARPGRSLWFLHTRGERVLYTFRIPNHLEFSTPTLFVVVGCFKDSLWIPVRLSIAHPVTPSQGALLLAPPHSPRKLVPSQKQDVSSLSV